MNSFKYCILISFLFLVQFSNAQQIDSVAKKQVPLLHGAHRTGRRTDSLMQHWRDYGFGQFIHFGIYSMFGGEWQGKPYDNAAEFIRGFVPTNIYDSAYKKFNPTKFNPTEWANMSKQMGARYVTITTKHHDGFCLWPTKYSRYNVSNTPYKKDVIGPLVNAYNQQEIDVYLYYSILDWTNPDWRYDLKTKEDTVAFDRFKVFVKNQLTELLKNYPTIKGLWFDGTWDKSWQKSGAFSDSLEQYLKQIHPGLIIGSRLRADDYGNRHFDANGNLMGDYEQGWERKLPKVISDTHGNDWDCIMTFGENGWGYQNKWLGHWKTAYELEEMMAQCNSLDGNFALNFGPKGDGTFREKETDEAKQIGNWMSINNRAIYDVKYAGWQKQDWGYYTQSNDSSKVYMIVFNIPLSKNLKIIPAKNVQVKAAHFLQGGKALPIEKLDEGALQITLPKKDYQQPFVIELNVIKGETENAEKNNHV